MTLTLILSLALATTLPQSAIHELTDGSLVEGRLVKTRTGVRIDTPFGRLRLEAGEYRGRAATSLDRLADEYRGRARGLAVRDAARWRRLGSWCEAMGYQTGLRRVLDHLLRHDADDRWARRKVDEIAKRYRMSPLEGSQRNRDQRRLIEYLLEDAARRSHVDAVIAAEKACALPAALTLRPAITATRDSRSRVRWAAARILQNHKQRPERIKPLYRLSLADASRAVRVEAVRALKRDGDDTLIALFAGQLTNPEAIIRVRAAEALVEHGGIATIAPLIGALADTWRPTRNVAAFTNQVAYVKDYDVEVAQTAFIADPLVDVVQEGQTLEAAIIQVDYERRLYRKALGRLAGVDLGDKPGPWRDWLKKQSKRDENRER